MENKKQTQAAEVITKCSTRAGSTPASFTNSPASIGHKIRTMEKNDKIRFLVSSKTFRQHLKLVSEAYACSEEFEFVIVNGVMSIGTFSLSIETREEGKMVISHKSINKTIKALKQASDQPIAVRYEETWSCFNINCCF